MVSSVTDTGIYYMQDSLPGFNRSLSAFFNNPEYSMNQTPVSLENLGTLSFSPVDASPLDKHMPGV